MKRALAAAALLAGCTSTAVVRDASGDIDLAFCAFDANPGGQWGSFFARKMRELPPPSFESVRGIASLNEAEGCDLAAEIRSSGATILSPTSATVYSAASRKKLFSVSATGRGQPGKLGRSILREFQRDGEPYRLALAERAARGNAYAPARPGAPNARRSDVDSPGYRAPQRPNDFAVVIGIDGYKDLPRAEFAERDAEAAASHFAALGVPKRHIVSLYGENATRTGLTKYLEEWLPRNAKPESTVYFFFSGHGAPDPKTGAAYLVPWDGDASFLKSTAYPLDKLYSELGKLPAKRVVVALDACFSGAGGRSVLAKGARPLVTKVRLASRPLKNLTMLTASAGDEITTTLDAQGHGVFTYYLLKGLQGAAADASGTITATGLYEYLRPKVQEEARLQNREQTPSLFYITDPVLR
ncbi:MAG: hypothetical protein AUJ52_12600 [Elusimicrobia bacterium CG1_02_63_36]|nr:MAG: hypothetical protein AUJ52_12600 [Elusimicrobia bacterium CG1_02_63_36]PIP83599.1 MAG: hypothetical protein COR54_09110 [Elusimicrobia bacterium CG22_combo_CG10-13_8_21_14_all_63_91]PJA13179.1 MAG: hypothetical protein COX66_15955 [Elusimicrobia bacterium CG_4_10_14_0_2_um_filter_63_34]PJB24408.1 MAG: hypothetical protein CO113_13875 [Elusimicrobia bacterium CG_4_9_14_3_um_filter_62_55]